MQSPTKGPDTSEGEVGLIELTRRIWWGVFRGQKTVEQSAEGLSNERNKAVLICSSEKLISVICFNLGTCTMEFSGMGTMVLKVFLIRSRQRGTYFSNSMVRWARSVWCSLWSIQLATYLDRMKPKWSQSCNMCKLEKKETLAVIILALLSLLMLGQS